MSERQRKDLPNDDKGLFESPEAIVGEAKSHPVGTRVGAYGGGLAGALAGVAVGGPAGGVVGTAVGALAGGLAGIAAAHKVDPAVEDAYWRDAYRTRPYVVAADETYETFEPAYRYGWESRLKFRDRSWDELEPELGRDWDRARGSSSLEWERARLAAEDAWRRVDPALSGAGRDRH